jgi:hypothetical protein
MYLLIAPGALEHPQQLNLPQQLKCESPGASGGWSARERSGRRPEGGCSEVVGRRLSRAAVTFGGRWHETAAGEASDHRTRPGAAVTHGERAMSVTVCARAGRPVSYPVILENEGLRPEDIKAAAAERWVAAVNSDGSFGDWRYAIVHDPNEIRAVLAAG